MTDNSTFITTALSFLLIFGYFFLTSTQVNYDIVECMNYAKAQLIKPLNKIEGVFFVPDDPLKQVLIGLIHHEKRAIRAAVYQLTDPDIVDALVSARRRGVSIEIITDKSCLESKYEKITQLKKHGIKVYVYRKSFSIMHNKVWHFSMNLYNKALVMFGSANTTQGGLTRNEENMVVTDRVTIVRSYKEKFDRLKEKVQTMNSKPKPKKEHNGYLRFLYSIKSLFNLNFNELYKI